MAYPVKCVLVFEVGFKLPPAQSREVMPILFYHYNLHSSETDYILTLVQAYAQKLMM